MALDVLCRSQELGTKETTTAATVTAVEQTGDKTISITWRLFGRGLGSLTIDLKFFSLEIIRLDLHASPASCHHILLVHYTTYKGRWVVVRLFAAFLELEPKPWTTATATVGCGPGDETILISIWRFIRKMVGIAHDRSEIQSPPNNNTHTLYGAPSEVDETLPSPSCDWFPASSALSCVHLFRKTLEISFVTRCSRSMYYVCMYQVCRTRVYKKERVALLCCCTCCVCPRLSYVELML